MKHKTIKRTVLNNRMKKNNFLCTLLLFTFSLVGMFSTAQKLETVSVVDLEKYAGKWYEISSFPQIFQEGCFCTTAEYTLTNKKFVIVENRCNRGGINGAPTYIKGKAFVKRNSENAKLKVQFFWPFKAKYWIIDLAEDYSFAVIGHPNRKYLWILSRTPKMDETIYNALLFRLQQNGFDLTKLKKTEQI
jgi:apolipoprotein D and lipocalin family protein